VVIDEAHKLRNVYKKKAKTAQAIKEALSDVKKLLLTATPFQNSLMELFGQLLNFFVLIFPFAHVVVSFSVGSS
jgi:SNF2 family DNA or RNA helicase